MPIAPNDAGDILFTSFPARMGAAGFAGHETGHELA